MIGEIIRVFVYAIIIVAILAMLLVPVELAEEYFRRRRKYKKERKEIELNIRVWESIAKSCDSITEAYDKGYAIARLVIYHHELEELETNRRREII